MLVPFLLNHVFVNHDRRRECGYSACTHTSFVSRHPTASRMDLTGRLVDQSVGFKASPRWKTTSCPIWGLLCIQFIRSKKQSTTNACWMGWRTRCAHTSLPLVIRMATGTVQWPTLQVFVRLNGRPYAMRCYMRQPFLTWIQGRSRRSRSVCLSFWGVLTNSVP